LTIATEDVVLYSQNHQLSTSTSIYGLEVCALCSLTKADLQSLDIAVTCLIHASII